MAWPAVIADFKAYFVREFVYGSTVDKILDADITKALGEATMVFNEGLWNNVGEKSIAFLYLTAHYLVLDIQNAGGIAGGTAGKGLNSAGGGIVSSKSVGSVSVSYAVPQYALDSPTLGPYAQTGFGRKYLSLIYPRLIGNVAVISGQPPGIPNGE